MKERKKMARNEINGGNNLSPSSNKDSIPKDSDNTRFADDDNHLNLNLSKDKPPQDPDNARLILVFIAGGLATLCFIGYIITGNTNVLLGTSVLAYPLMKVIDYYFPRKDR
jgi:hypothetical protein